MTHQEKNSFCIHAHTVCALTTGYLSMVEHTVCALTTGYLSMVETSFQACLAHAQSDGTVQLRIDNDEVHNSVNK